MLRRCRLFDTELAARVRDLLTTAAAKQGRPVKDENKPCDTRFIFKANNATYVVARLKRDDQTANHLHTAQPRNPSGVRATDTACQRSPYRPAAQQVHTAPMRCSSTDPNLDLDQQQCDQVAVAVVGIIDDRVTISGAVCSEHIDAAVAWLHSLDAGTVAVTRLG